jgi:hypothetical protein
MSTGTEVHRRFVAVYPSPVYIQVEKDDTSNINLHLQNINRWEPPARRST